MASFLVTGCAGFIGSHLCETLIQRGDKVTGLDTFTDYYNETIKRRNLSSLSNQSAFTLLETDLVRDDLVPLLDQVDGVFHTAGQPGVRGSWGGQFNLYLDNNILATQRLLEAIRLSGKNIRIVYSSSSSIYGNTDQLPTSETALPKPYSPYGMTKLAAEHLCGLYFANYRIPTVSLRYFTVYGPRQRPDMAFNIFIQALLEGRKIKILGDGAQTRDFTYVADIVKGNLLAMEKAVEGEIFNIGGGSRISLMDVIPVLEGISGQAVQMEILPSSKGDVRDTSADITKAQESLGYAPEWTVEQGLREQFQWQYRIHEENALAGKSQAGS